MKGESVIWSAATSVVGVSFVAVAVSLVVVSLQRGGDSDAGAPASSGAVSAVAEAAGSREVAAPGPGASAAPSAASGAASAEADGGAADGAAPEPGAEVTPATTGGASAALKPWQPKAATTVKKPLKPKPRKPH